MPTYRFCGLAFTSEVRPAGLEPSIGEPVLRCVARDALPPIKSWSRVWRLPDGSTSLCAARDASGHRLRFPGVAEFTITPDRREILASPEGGSSRATLGRLLVAQVLPRLLGLEGRLVLHGGVVRAPEGAVALLGESGAGKSTLCAAIGRTGVPVLTDDCFAVETPEGEIVAVPGVPELRLLPDVQVGAHEASTADGDGKRTFRAGGPFAFASAPAPLVRIYVLEPREPAPEGGVEVSLLPPAAAFTALVRNSFQLDLGAPERAARLLDTVARLVERIPVRALRFPQRPSLLPALRRAVLGD